MPEPRVAASEWKAAEGTGAGMGRMADTFDPAGVFTRTWFIRNRVVCGAWPGAPMLKEIGTKSWAGVVAEHRHFQRVRIRRELPGAPIERLESLECCLTAPYGGAAGDPQEVRRIEKQRFHRAKVMGICAATNRSKALSYLLRRRCRGKRGGGDGKGSKQQTDGVSHGVPERPWEIGRAVQCVRARQRESPWAFPVFLL